MKDIYIIMNRQNILNYYGSKLDLKLDSSELYDYQLTTNEVDYDTDVLDLTTPIVYSTLVIDTNLTDFDCNRTTITLTEYDNRVNNPNYPYSALTTTISYTGFTNFISNYHKRIILNNDVYIFEGITGEVHYMRITGYNNPLSFNPNMGNSSEEIVNKFDNEYLKCTSKLSTLGSRACCPITPKLSSKPWAYQFYQLGTNCTSPIIKQRTENGWTLDFVFNREGLPWLEGNIFYYYGVRGSTSDTETADNSLSFKFTSDGKIEYNAVRYSGNCDPVMGYSEYYYTEVGITPTLCTTDLNKDFNVTIVFERYKQYQDCELENEGGLNDQIPEFRINEYLDLEYPATSTQIAVHNDDTILNKKWWEEREKRLGVLNIFLNGNLIYKKENFEEVIASNRGIQPFIQSWGGVDNEAEGVCCFNIKSIKYYEEPLDFIHVKHNFRTRLDDFDFEICNAPCVDDVRAYVPPTATPTVTPSPTPVPTSTSTPIPATSTPTPQPTNISTSTPTITPTPTVTNTPTPTPTPSFETNTTGFTFPFDFMLVEYFFTDGEDMDTQTYISNPSIMTFSDVYDEGYVGTCGQSDTRMYFPNDQSPILTYGHDNLGVGTEAVLFDLTQFKLQYSGDTNIELTFTSVWFENNEVAIPGVNPVYLRATLWQKNGSFLPQSDGYTFIYPESTNTLTVQNGGKVITSTSGICEPFELVGKFQYNIDTYFGQFI